MCERDATSWGHAVASDLPEGCLRRGRGGGGAGRRSRWWLVNSKVGVTEQVVTAWLGPSRHLLRKEGPGRLGGVWYDRVVKGTGRNRSWAAGR